MTTGAQKFPSRLVLAGKEDSHPTHETILPRSVEDVLRKAEDVKNLGYHSSRHSFAIHLLEGGYDIQTVKELPGHNDVKTMICTHESCAV